MAKKREKRFQTPAELIAELGFFYSNGRTTPVPAAPYLRAEPEIAPTPLPAYVPLWSPPQDKILDATKVVPGLASDLPRPSGEIERTAAIDLSANVAVMPQQATQVVAFDESVQEAATVRERSAEMPCKPLTSITALLEAWRDWMSVIARLTAGQPLELSGAEYRALHGRLLAECEAARAGSDGALIVDKMLEVIQPWVSLEALPIADRATLVSLYGRCVQIDKLLGRDKTSIWIWVIAVAVLTCLFIVGRLLFEHAAELRTATLVAFVRSHPYISLAGGVPILVALTFFFVKRR
jgi:hypothetical protein